MQVRRQAQRQNRNGLCQRLSEKRSKLRSCALRRFGRNLRKDRTQCGRDFELASLRYVCEDIAVKMHGAALPARTLHYRCDRGFEPLVRVTDNQLGAGESAFAEAPQKRRPAFFAFGVHYVDCNDVSKASCRHAVSDDDGVANHGAVDPDLFIQRVKPETDTAR